MSEAERFKSFYDVWPKGFKQFQSEVTEIGFEITLAGIHSQELFSSHEYLKALRTPRSCEFQEASSSEFTYLSTASKVKTMSPHWGLVIVDSKNTQAIEKYQGLRLLKTNDADALVDYILRKTTEPEWHGESSAMPIRVHSESQVVIGPNSTIGDGTILETGVRIGARVKIGRNCRIGAFSRISDDSVIGDNCVMTSHASIGGQGFGFVKYPLKNHKQPRIHVGRVVVGHGVRLGAFVAIDRGVFEDTLVGSDSSFDNTVQVGHNAVVGRNGIICSMVALAGSSHLGDRVTIGGLVGVKDHVKVGNDVTIAAQSGVNRNIGDKEIVKGYPPRPLKEALEIQMLQSKLPEIWERLKKLEKEKKT